MRPFRDGPDEYTASIAVDASTHGDVTTAVAVLATREDEVDILNRIYSVSCRCDVTFIPFKSKSSYYSKEEDDEFFANVVSEGVSYLKGLHFHHHSASKNQHYVEAVLGALLFKDIIRETDEDPFVLIDGDTSKVKTFAKACAGIDMDSPTLANCYKSEWYYPHSLLADLSAGYQAWQIENGHYDYSNPVFRIPAADVHRQEDWGRAFSFLQRKQNQSGYTHLQIGSTAASQEAERARIWYDGLVARGRTDASPSTGMSYIATEVEGLGYPDLASRLRVL